MTVELGESWIRLDGRDLDQLLNAKIGVSSEIIDRVGDALVAAREPALIVTLVVAGPEVRLEHTFWIGETAMGMLLAVDEDRWQLMADISDFLPAALVRTTCMGFVQEPIEESVPFDSSELEKLISVDVQVRTPALSAASAGSAWRLLIDDGTMLVPVWATQGEHGSRTFDAESGAFVTASNTQLFRIFSTIVSEFTSAA